MNEEQAVLDFFSQTKNLPLGLAVAEEIDKLRKQINNLFWQELSSSIKTLFAESVLSGQIKLTEDRNTPDCLIGLYYLTNIDQPIYLQPMMEQQFFGDTWRIYFGLMWSTTPTHAQLGLPSVSKLKASLQQVGFKSNESFLAWKWTNLHPRGKDFILRYSQQPEELLAEMEALLKTLLIEHGLLIEQANKALKAAPPSFTTSLEQLRNELID